MYHAGKTKQAVRLAALISFFIFMPLNQIHPQTLFHFDFPHGVLCGNCHTSHHSGDPQLVQLLSAPTNIDDTRFNQLCWSCHDDITAPFVKTHSSLTTDNSYGDWSVECRLCHNPHDQYQYWTWRPDSYLETGTSTGIVQNSPVAGQSTFTDSGAAWTPGLYQAVSDRFYVLVSDTSANFKSYKILNNTATSLTVEGVLSTADTGKTYAVVYGKLINSAIVLDKILAYTGTSTSVTGNTLTETGAGWTNNQFSGFVLIADTKDDDITYAITGNTSDTITVSLPITNAVAGDIFEVRGIKTGSREVRFYDKEGANSFSDGNATYDGICEVCHTLTNHFRNNGSGPDQNHTNMGSVTGTDCAQCHSHADGFKPNAECRSCHNQAQTLVYNTRQIVEKAGDGGGDFIKASRHVSNGTSGTGNETVTSYDCAVCHAEGDVAKINAGTGWTSDTLHNDGSTSTDRMVNLRNVDDYAGTTYNFNKNAITEAMRDNMDLFCMRCHDVNGASTIAVNNTNDGLLTGSSANTTIRTGSITTNLRPFNTSDNLRNARDGLTTRTRVIDVDSQFNTANPSHHAVKGARYSTTNASWTAATWVNHTLRDTSQVGSGVMNVTRERAVLHCSDCHLSETNAHGASNAWHMLLNGISNDYTNDTAMTGLQLSSNLDILNCYKCHNRTVYMGDNPATGSRHTHDDDSNWYDANYGGTGNNDQAYLGPPCLNCHSGDGFGHIHGRGSPTDGDNTAYNSPPGSNAPYTKYRFMPGAWMQWSPRAGGGTTSQATNDTFWNQTQSGNMCYFPASATTWSACTHHNGNQARSATNYARPTSY